MRDSTITRRYAPPSRRRRPRYGLADHNASMVRRLWRAFWRGVEHPRLVQGAVLLFPLLTLLLLLAHLLAACAGPAQGHPAKPTPPVLPVASQVQAFYQGDPSIGWDSRAQYDRWWQSACAPAALTMALRAWGAPVRIGPVLDHLIALQAITPDAGLLHAEALATVAKGYGFEATTFWHWRLSDVAQVTGQGVPVLIDVVDAEQ